MEERAQRQPSMRVLQAIDRRLGPLAALFLRPLALLRRRLLGEPQNILMIKFWGLGSLQLATPAARALRRVHPDSKLTLLTLSSNRELAEGLGVFDEVRCLDLSGAGWGALALRLYRMLRGLRGAGYDRVYDFEFFTWFSALASLASGAPRTFGFADAGARRGGLHTDTVPFNRYWHVARNFRALAGGETGADVSARDLSPFRVQAAHERELDAVLKQGARPLVVINPNAGDLAPERRWPTERFGAVAARLAREDGAHVVITGSPSERDKTAAVLLAAGPHLSGRIQDLGGALSIGALNALFQRADLVLTNDSGPMHLAAAQGAPTLGLFGPETPVMYAPIGEPVEVHYAPPLCSPCINVHDAKALSCIHGQPECLMRIEVEGVLKGARALIAAQGERKEEVPACVSSS